MNLDWFIALFASAVIGRSNYFVFVLRHLTENRSKVISHRKKKL